MPWLYTEIEPQKNNRSRIHWRRRAVIECDRCKAVRRRYVWHKPLSQAGVFCGKKCGALGRWDAQLGPEAQRSLRECTACGVAKPPSEFDINAASTRLRARCKTCAKRKGWASTKRAQQALREMGLCLRCGTMPAAPLMARCRPCLDLGVAAGKAQRAVLKRENRCIGCRGPNTTPGLVCVRCWFKRTAKDTIDDRSRWAEIETLWHRQGGQCALTGDALIAGAGQAALDHIVPQFSGGSHEIENLRWTTRASNTAKNAMSESDFIAMCRRVVETHDARCKNEEQDGRNQGRDAAE